MLMFDVIPLDVVLFVVSEWFDVKVLGHLDIAIGESKGRKFWVDLLRNDHLKIKTDSKTICKTFGEWLVTRKLNVASLTVSTDVFHKVYKFNALRNIYKSHIIELRFTENLLKSYVDVVKTVGCDLNACSDVRGLRPIICEDIKLNAKAVSDMFNECPQLTSLVFENFGYLSDQAIKGISFLILTRLEVFAMYKSSVFFTGRGIEHLSQHCTNLTTLTLRFEDSGLNDTLLLALFVRNPLLRNVWFEFNNFAVCDTFFSGLIALHQKDNQFGNQLKFFKVHNHLNEPHPISLPVLLQFIETFPHLKHVSLTDSSDRVFTYTNARTARKRVLHVSKLDTVDPQGHAKRALVQHFSQSQLGYTHIHLVQGGVICDEVVAAIGTNNPSLQALHLWDSQSTFGAASLRSVMGGCQSLVSLKLTGCLGLSGEDLVALFSQQNSVLHLYFNCNSALTTETLCDLLSASECRVASVSLFLCARVDVGELRRALAVSCADRRVEVVPASSTDVW